ncbi:alpha/beta hydrolase family protein [Actinomyces howellii]|uniref:Alpha/beta hydrolase family n=1 Tax=Actinomyces howellii TaxID=52771 RepID=A0A3S4R127_9ACTO|nr:alpha/beta hydrolase [Actinomyces howellii]VEG28320.1 Alpha/beta hydrolase family [Actinomyces howellii]
MTEVRIATARGIALAGTLRLPANVTPVDLEAEGPAAVRQEGVVILAHDFLTDRHGLGDRLDMIAAAYRREGLATLQFDFSGLGLSDDDVITLAGEVEDIQAVSGWLASHGYVRQAIHANGFGATAALLARPERVRTAVLVGAVVGPQSILWENVFSPEQLDELDRHGLTRLPDDNPNPRQWDVLSKETLADVSLQSPDKTMADLPWPVLMLQGALTDELPDTADAAAQGFALLPEGSRLHRVRAADTAEAQAEVARLGAEWISRRLR